MKHLSYFLILIFNLSHVFKANEEIAKKTKVLACIALSRARMVQDSDFISSFIDGINQKFGITDGKNKMMSICLVNCYQSITSEKALELLQMMQHNNQIDSMTKEHKQILGLEDNQLNNLGLQNDEFSQTYNEVNRIIQELGKEQEQLKSKGGDFTGGANSGASLLDSFALFVFSLIGQIGSLLIIDGTLGIFLLILGGFFLLKFLKDASTKKKKVKDNKQKVN